MHALATYLVHVKLFPKASPKMQLGTQLFFFQKKTNMVSFSSMHDPLIFFQRMDLCVRRDSSARVPTSNTAVLTEKLQHVSPGSLQPRQLTTFQRIPCPAFLTEVSGSTLFLSFFLELLIPSK